MKKSTILIILFLIGQTFLFAQGTRLLRQPALSDKQIAFTYGGDLWICDLGSSEARRLTSTPAVESDPHFSPDGKSIAFTSNRSGVEAIYVLPVTGGTPIRLTWYPQPSNACGWTPDGKKVLYSTSRETAPVGFNRLWTVPVNGGPSELIPAPRGNKACYSPDGKKIAIEPISRWDVEWRNYKGGQNTSIRILDLDNLGEVLLPNERTMDLQPVWLENTIYFLSDRDKVMNIWSYETGTGTLKQITSFKGSDIKSLEGYGKNLVYERDGYLYLFDLQTANSKQLEINVNGDFPWSETVWQNVSNMIQSVSLSATGKRALAEARGEIFTIPVENGSARNLSKSSDAADHAPVWAPNGSQVAWFSDKGGSGYALLIANQDGLSEPKKINIGDSKMAWEPAWSPDGKKIAFEDDDVRIRIVDVDKGTIETADTGGTNIERGGMGLTWSFDSKWLAYSKTGANNFRRIFVWNVETKKKTAITDFMADSYSPAWDRDGKHLYFLASTDLGLGSGWANTSAMGASPNYAVYLINLKSDEVSPFKPLSDEESDSSNVAKDQKSKAESDKAKEKKKNDEEKKDIKKQEPVKIDFEGIERRTIALPLPSKNYFQLFSGPAGSVFIWERSRENWSTILNKFKLTDKKSEVFVSNAQIVTISGDGKKMLVLTGGAWKVVGTENPPGPDTKILNMTLRMQLDRIAEWKQMFNEAWRYERDYFYDPNMHGRNWTEVYERYNPLIPYIKHRCDLTYILDQVNGELSVGHSFVFGGDYPSVDTSRVGLIGADLSAKNGLWMIKHIYTSESWNPGLKAPLDRPGLKIKPGYYILEIDGKKITDKDDPYKFLDGTADRQVLLLVNSRPTSEGAWKETIETVQSEYSLRQRAWVEDNRRYVDSLSGGKLAYVWVPNTGGNGVVSFNRYLFSQQDKLGAVIDERFNGGGLLDDYMVDLMTRKLRAAITNEVPKGKPFMLPAGILGPKVLLINELSGSGGDFFPWVFRHQNAGPLIGTRTWGGLVKSSVHYSLVDGGALTAPDNAVFDPVKKQWIAENEGIAPDIEVILDAKSFVNGKDPQLERAVKEALLLLEKEGVKSIEIPAFSTPAK
ncbi:MAG: PDZ domain-containing protein [Bacteroidales bacterium]